LVSINGSLGYFAYYNNEKCFLGKSACYFNVKENISKRFIGYQIRTNYFQKYIEHLAAGTTIKNV
jgi:type I restriction enzyme S subunit